MAFRFFMHAAISGFLVVALGAFGAHGLQDILTQSRLETWNTAVLYQMFHVVGQVAIALLCQQFPASRYFVWSGYGFLIGLILFSGSLYLLCLTDISALAYITPIGGLVLLAAWALMAYGLSRISREA